MATVLLVDDSSFSRRRIKNTLSQIHNGDIVEAVNGQDALEKFRDHSPDLVLLDLTMPVMDGYTALERIMQRNPKAKVAIVSADVQQRAKDRVEAAGAVAFVQKPPTEAELQRLVKLYVG